VIALEKARSCLEVLGLLPASEILDSRLQKAASDGSTYADFLSDILSEEIAKRRQRNVEVRSKLANFPFERTLEEFDFQPSVDKKLIMELATLSFLSEAVNVVFLGPPVSARAIFPFLLAWRLLTMASRCTSPKSTTC
jgi:DNA replication protein DnaC